MNRIYEKSKLRFALIWIGVYVIGMSLADSASEAAGIPSLFSVILLTAVTTALLHWNHTARRSELFGLCTPKTNGSWWLCSVPLLVISCVNLLFGALTEFCLPVNLFAVAAMLLVGIVEELIFRGLLFTALREENLTRAVVISALTFGIGHIVNLLNGAPLFSTLLQLCYAAALGLAFTLLFHYSGSLIPCILSHALIDITSLFVPETEAALALEAPISAVLIVVTLIYAAWLHRRAKTA